MSKSLLEGLDDHYAAQAADAPEGMVPGNRPWARALKSVALAVHPDQVAEACADAEAKGVPTNFTADGCPEFRDRDHRKRYLQAYGFFDRDAGYGDAQPKLHKGRVPPPSRAMLLGRKLARYIRVRRESRRD